LKNQPFFSGAVRIFSGFEMLIAGIWVSKLSPVRQHGPYDDGATKADAAAVVGGAMHGLPLPQFGQDASWFFNRRLARPKLSDICHRRVAVRPVIQAPAAERRDLVDSGRSCLSLMGPLF
jgi:hypothetical protein